MITSARRQIRHLSTTALAAAALCIGVPSTAAPPLYRVTVLPQPALVSVTPVAINNQGQVIGNLDASLRHAAVVCRGAPYVLSRLPDVKRPGGFSLAAGLNDNGTIVGESTGTSITYQIPVSWTPRVSSLPTPTGGSGNARAINNSGTAVGVAEGRAALWTQGTAAALIIGALPGGQASSQQSTAAGINDDGVVVGTSPYNRQGNPHAFVWSASTSLRDLGALRDAPLPSLSIGTAINRAGQVIGQASDVTGTYKPFIWTAERGMRDLGTVPKTQSNNYQPRSINMLGAVLGTYDDSTSGGNTFLWTETDGMADVSTLIDPLDPLYGQLASFSGMSINDLGQILAAASVNGHVSVVVLTPTP